MRKNIMRVSVEESSTWTKHEQWLCSTCKANCCTMRVEVKLLDLIRIGVITRFESVEPIYQIAKKLKKEGVIEHLYLKEKTFVLVRLANNDCLYLDSTSRKCKIYKKRPDTCRNHPHIGPRPGFCAYEEK